MSLTFESTLRMRVPPEAFFAAYRDMEAWPSWMRGAVRVERLTSGEFGVGTQWRETRRQFGSDSSEVFEVTHWEPPRCVEVFVDGRKGSSGSGSFRFRCDVVPAGGGSEVRMHGEVVPPRGFRGLMARLFIRSFHKACEGDLRAMQAHLEAAAPTA